MAEIRVMREDLRPPTSPPRRHFISIKDVSRDDIGFDAGDNEVVLITAAGERRVAKAPKGEIAAAVVDAAEELLREQAR